MTKDSQECHGAANGDNSVPNGGSSAPVSRSFLGRAAAFLSDEAGLSQFLALGTGTDPEGGTSDVAREMRTDSRVVYADTDPEALSRARSLLTGRAPGTTDFFQPDLRNPESVLGRTADTLDYGRPVGVLLHAAVESPATGGPGDPHRIITALMNVLPSGSYLAVTARDEPEAARFLDALSLVEPGLVPVRDWRRDPADHPDEDVRPAGDTPAQWGGVGRKP